MNRTGKIISSVLVASIGAAAIYYVNKYVKKRGKVMQESKSFDFSNAISMIESEEGFSSTPYWDNTQWTWGYGTAAGFNKNVKPQGTITMDQAQNDLLTYIQGLYQKMMMRLNVTITDNQTTALLDFGYNLGWGNLKNIIDNINKGYTPDMTASEMKLYVNSEGIVDSDLVTRRSKEANLYLS